jgi:flagellar hook assembly protein FlgD
VLSIYDTAGRLVRRLDHGVREPGKYTVEWDGRDARGRAVKNGVYFYRLDGVRGIPSRKMVLRS